MSALAVTPNNCIVTGTYSKILIQAGETLTAGAIAYQKSSDSKYWLAQNDGTAEESGSGVQMVLVLGNCVANQFVGGLTSGTVTSGATHTKGYTCWVHSTAGAYTETQSDLTSGKYVTVVGVATTTAILNVAFNATGLTIT